MSAGIGSSPLRLMVPMVGRSMLYALQRSFNNSVTAYNFLTSFRNNKWTIWKKCNHNGMDESELLYLSVIFSTWGTEL